MIENMPMPNDDADDHDAADHQEETMSPAHADRPPTEAEEAAAERAAETVDLDRVAEHMEAAIETGANVRGEGEIEPSLGSDQPV